MIDELVNLSDTCAGFIPRWVRRFILTPLIVLCALYLAFAIYYWLPWPAWLRVIGCAVFPAGVIAAWLTPGRTRAARQAAAIVAILGLFVAYFAKSPTPQDWVDLHARTASVAFAGDMATIANYRDALHTPGQPSVPRWTTATFDISKLQTADLIIQPFGNNKAFAHVMLSFGFADGRHVVVSMESRQAKGASFSAVSGFFRHDELYPELATERDLFWERLSRTPPDELQIYPILQSPEVLRIYFRRILVFANKVHDRPVFYSTLGESCMTALINLAPESFASVQWYDVRRWIPGYALPLFQQLKLVDNRMSASDFAMKQRIRDNVLPPQAFASDALWSVYVRQKIAAN